MLNVSKITIDQPHPPLDPWPQKAVWSGCEPCVKWNKFVLKRVIKLNVQTLYMNVYISRIYINYNIPLTHAVWDMSMFEDHQNPIYYH